MTVLAEGLRLCNLVVQHTQKVPDVPPIAGEIKNGGALTRRAEPPFLACLACLVHLFSAFV